MEANADRTDVAAMAEELFKSIEVPFEKTSELERQVLSTFAFGMIFAFGKSKGMAPPVVHALVIACLMDSFHYADHQASEFSASLIAIASDRSRNPTMNAIIHRGIDGHRQWEQKKLGELKANLVGVLKVLAGGQR